MSSQNCRTGSQFTSVWPFPPLRICLRITWFFLSTQVRTWFSLLMELHYWIPTYLEYEKVGYFLYSDPLFWLNVKKYMLMLLQWLYHVKLFLFNIKLLLLIIPSMLSRFLKYRICQRDQFCPPLFTSLFSELIISSFKEYLSLLFFSH